MKADVTTLRSGGLRIYVTDPETDTLAVIEVRRSYDCLMARVGLRGNYSADRRPMRWVVNQVEALVLTAAQRAENRARYFERARRAGWLR